MDIRSPPPPSPTASEPPPSYDSLTPISQHPPYHTCLPTTALLPPAPPGEWAPELQHGPLQAPELQHGRHEAPELQHGPLQAPELQHGTLQAPGLRHEAPELQHRTLQAPGLRHEAPELQPTSGQQQELMTITEEEMDYLSLPPGLRNPQCEGSAEAPPSYYSLFGQIQHARQQTSNNVAFLKKLCHIIFRTIGCTFLLVVLMFIPLTVLVLGIVYVRDCPLQPLIPHFLIIGGMCGVIKTILLLSENVVRKNAAAFSWRVRHPRLLIGFWRACNLAFNIFVLSWVVTGSYWIYSVYHQVVSTGYSMCNIVLYKFSFSFVTCSYFLLLIIFSWTFFLGISALRRRKTRARSRSEGSVTGGSGILSAGPEGGGTQEEEGVASAEEGGVQGVASEGVELRGVASVGRADSNVHLEFGGVISDRGVASSMEELDNEDGTGRENAITAGGTLVSIRVQGAEQMDSLTRSSPHLYHDPSTCLHHPSVTMASSPHLNRDPSVTSAPLSTMASPHLHHHLSATITPSAPLPETTVTMTAATPPGLHVPRTSLRSESPSRLLSLHTFRQRIQSVDSSDSGLLSNPPRYLHALIPTNMRRMVSCSAMQGPVHKNIMRHHSIPSLRESHYCDLDPRHLGSGDSGNESNRSSLYNTVHAEGYSITAV